MSYTINLTDGTIFAVVADGTINSDSSQILGLPLQTGAARLMD